MLLGLMPQSMQMIESPTHATRHDMSGFVGCIRVARQVGRSLPTQGANMKITKRKRTVPAKRNRAALAKQKHVPTGDAVLESPGRKWQLRVGPKETVFAAENAPLCQLVIQNLGPDVVEVHSGDSERETVILMPGKLSVMLAYGRIKIENVEEKWAIVEMEFMPRMKF
jgi:hypothetical protein